MLPFRAPFLSDSLASSFPQTVIRTSGTGATETVPTGAKLVRIRVRGGGGSGGVGFGAYGGSGGGGGFSQTHYSCTGGQTLTYTVGGSVAGRLWGSGAGSGTAGNQSQCSSGSLSITTMNGNGGGAGAAAAGGAGGTASGGFLNISGGAGGVAANGGAGGGTGGGSGGTISVPAGSAPGGGGYGGHSLFADSGAGARGEVEFYYTIPIVEIPPALVMADSQFGSIGAQSSVIFGTDGSMGLLGNGSNDGGDSSWIDSTQTGIGNAFWIRMTVTSGDALSGDATGSWLRLSATRQWDSIVEITGTKNTNVTIDIASDSAGSTIVATLNTSFSTTAEI